MYFPWCGMLEQIKLADIFIFYDDVQFSKGFINRVQIKTKDGVFWLTIPLKNKSQDTKILDIKIDHRQPWQRQHLLALKHAYASAPYFDQMYELANNVIGNSGDSLSDFVQNSMIAVSDFYKLSGSTSFVRSSDLNIQGKGSERLLSICKKLSADNYITGHGALNYLDESIFRAENVNINLMDYMKLPYPQLYGEFTPFVSSLDLIANCGMSGQNYITPKTRVWN
jgi:hypothetical protein